MTTPILSRTLDNGLVLVAEPNSSMESAAFSFMLPAGCAVEPAVRGGLATLLTEMTMRGAGRRDARALVADLDTLGVERADSVSSAHASYSVATLAHNLEPALEIYADVLRSPRLPSDQLEPARQVVLQELEGLEDEPSQKLMIELKRRQYPDPWGRPSQGDAEGLTAATLAEVNDFHSRRFRPNGTILGVAGRFEWPALCDAVQRLYGDWEPRTQEPPQGDRSWPKRDHIEHDSNQTQVGIAYASVPYKHPDYFAAWGAVGVLSGGMSSRLFTEVREKRGLCYTVFATYHTLMDAGSVLCYAGTSADRAQETLDVMLAELVRLAKGVEPAELARLKARIKSGLIMQQESSSARAGSIARDWYYLNRVRTLAELGRIVDELTVEQINAYLAAHPPGDFTIVTLGPEPLEVRGGIQ